MSPHKIIEQNISEGLIPLQAGARSALFLKHKLKHMFLRNAMERDSSLEDKPQIDAIRYSIDKGLNYLDLSFVYAEGYANALAREALKGEDRGKIFINAKLGNIEKVGDVEQQLDEYLDFFNLDYVDSFQIHSPSRIKPVGVEKTSAEIARLIDTSKARFFSVSNFGPRNLQLAQKSTGNKVFSLENDYSIDVRPCEDIGLLEYCNKHNILFIPYRPIRRKGVGLVSQLKYDVITKLAKRYDKTSNQILLNWYGWKSGVMPIVKSSDIKHIKENIKSFEFDMSNEDYKILDSFRIKHPGWKNIDWEYEGTGDTKISSLSFVFEG